MPPSATPVIAAPVVTVITAVTPILTATSEAPPRTTLEQILDEAIRRTVAHVTMDDMARLSAAIAASSSGIPQDYDGRLLGTCRILLGRDLTGDERREMRTVFKREVLTGRLATIDPT